MIVDDDLEFLLTIADVSERVALNRSTIYRYMRAGAFPLPKRVGLKAVRWRLGDIERWVRDLPDAKGDIGEQSYRIDTTPGKRRV